MARSDMDELTEDLRILACCSVFCNQDQMPQQVLRFWWLMHHKELCRSDRMVLQIARLVDHLSAACFSAAEAPSWQRVNCCCRRLTSVPRAAASLEARCACWHASSSFICISARDWCCCLLDVRSDSSSCCSAFNLSCPCNERTFRLHYACLRPAMCRYISRHT